jgi:hypothetical protein
VYVVQAIRIWVGMNPSARMIGDWMVHCRYHSADHAL